jgi:hypothetical protein
MWRLVAILGAAGLAVSAAGAAPVPVETRAKAILELNAAIADERRALELLRKDPPHLRAARDRIYRSADRVNGVYDFLSGVPDAAAGQDALGGARAGAPASDALRAPSARGSARDRVSRAGAATETRRSAVRGGGAASAHRARVLGRQGQRR